MTTMNFIDDIFQASTKHLLTRFWLFSDLQQGNPANAERFFRIAMEDFQGLRVPVNGICYLGDATEGYNLEAVKVMTEMQLGFLDSLDVPVYYTIGNHELDYYRYALEKGLKPFIPFYDAVKGRKNWHVPASQEDFWFAEEMPDFTMLFFSDHAAKNGDWYAFHEMLPDPHGQFPFPGTYPYSKQDWIAVRDRFAKQEKLVFTFSHCAFPGGNRPSQHLEQMMPLPPNFRAHFHGHAHIGDGRCAGLNLYRQITGMEGLPIFQFDIASLDHIRGTTVRSAFFDYYGDGEFGVFFRDHINARWEHFFLSAHDAASAGIPERFQGK